MNDDKSGSGPAVGVWTELDAAIVLAYTMAMAGGAICANVFNGGAAAANAQPISVMSALTGAFFPAMFAIMMLAVKSATTGLGIRSLLGIKRPAAEIGKGAIAGAGASIASIFLMYVSAHAYRKVFGQGPEAQPMIEALFSNNTPKLSVAIMAAGAVTLNPFAEEVLYRGVLVSALMKRRGPVAAVVISSMFFSLIHLHLPASLALFMAGAVFAAAYLASGSLLAATATHAAFNAANMAYAVAYAKWTA